MKLTGEQALLYYLGVMEHAAQSIIPHLPETTRFAMIIGEADSTRECGFKLCMRTDFTRNEIRAVFKELQLEIARACAHPAQDTVQ